MVSAILNIGPVSMAYEVKSDFMRYRSGIYKNDNCGTTVNDVNHAVLATGVGFDIDKKMSYFIVKNSWGVKWGDKGYFKIQEGKNMCALAVCNSFPNMG